MLDTGCIPSEKEYVVLVGFCYAVRSNNYESWKTPGHSISFKIVRRWTRLSEHFVRKYSVIIIGIVVAVVVANNNNNNFPVCHPGYQQNKWKEYID